MNVRLLISAISIGCLSSCASSHNTTQTQTSDNGYYTPTRYDDAGSGGYVTTDGNDSRVQSSSSTSSYYDAYAYEDQSAASAFGGPDWGFGYASPWYNPYSFYSPFGMYSPFGLGLGYGLGYRSIAYNPYYGSGFYYPYYPGYGYYGAAYSSVGLAYAPAHINLLPYSNRVYSGTTVNSIARPTLTSRPITSTGFAANTRVSPVIHNGFNTNNRSSRVVNRSNSALQFNNNNNRFNNYTQRPNNVQQTRTFSPSSSGFGGGGGFSRGGSSGGGGRRF